MEPVHHPIKTKKTEINIKKNISNEIYPEIYPVDEIATLNLEKIRHIICQSSAKSSQLFRSDVKKWQPVLVQLLHSLCRSEDIGKEITLLTSHAFLSLQRVLYTSQDFENSLKRYFDLQTNHLIDLGNTFDIYNLNLFKLLISNGFLQLGNHTKCSYEVYQTIFKIIYPRCIRYTQYTYFAFKILQTWMKRTSQIGLWAENSLELEEKMEAVIFSNWDNMICKANVIAVFATYLVIMKNKYEDFLPYLFYNCVERISWCHVTKYVLLSEICNALDNIELMTESKFISNLFNSLTIDYLCSASTKVYTIICNKVSKETWKSTFGIHLKNYVITWETEKKYHALQVLCKCWIEPIIKTHRDILPFLLECCDEGSLLYQTHLLRIANKYGVTPFLSEQLNNVILLDHEEEFIRLNVFAAHCYGTGNFNDDQYIHSLNAIKHFLYSNATADSTYLREGILNYFKIFFSNVLKRASFGKDPKEVILFLDWLYEFQMDCFEIGSCYQRKIFGLHLYKISLQFLYSNNCTDSILSKDPTFKEAIKYGPLLQHEMRKNNKWKFTDKQSVVSFFKLVLDPASDIRENSALIILDFFHFEVLSNSEKMSLFVIALSKCNSCKFFEIESGACLLKILTKWFPLNEVKKMDFNLSTDLKMNSSIDNLQSYTEFMLEEATQQLALVKRDIFKASTQNTPFYGVVTALLVIGFNNGPMRNFITEKFLEKVIDLAEDAVQYFLQAFSVKSSDSEHSSSFEEMGLAIDQAIKSSEIVYEFDELVLSPAQQLIIMTIWRSLKVLCDLAVEIAKNRYATDSLILRASEIIVTVSIKCRHKGVIESAGVAIANLTRHLCKNQKNVEILEGFLKKLLNNNFSTNVNLTRRGAGLTIMFHKIVVSDIRNNRPLLHFAVNSLLQSLGETFPVSFEQEHDRNHDNPLAMYLHFFKSLVADKQLQPQLSPYLERICLICFEYMPSEVFPIRNASFQLFGAIVSRLVGQNTGAKNVDFGYGYSINYFATHFPQLAAHVLLSLQACCQTLGENSHWQNSSNVIHILSLLSKMFFSGCELIDGTSRTYVKQIKSCLYFFLSSPIDHVRNLSAKAFTALTGSRSVEKEICELKLQISKTNNLNRLNGYLYTLEYLYEKKDDEIQSTTIKHKKIKSLSEVRKNLEFRSKTELLWNYWSRRCLLIQQKKLCYVVESQLLRLSRKLKIAIEENCATETKKKD